MSYYEVFPGTYFPVFSPNTGKYGPEKTPHLGTFHAMNITKGLKSSLLNLRLGSKYTSEVCPSHVFFKKID